MFLHLSVSHSVHRRGVCLSACWDTHPPGRHPPPGQTPPSPNRRPLQRMVRILLECFLVIISVSRSLSPSLYFSSGFNSRQECTPRIETPRTETPWTETPPDRDPRTETPPPTGVKTLPCRNFVAGGNNNPILSSTFLSHHICVASGLPHRIYKQAFNFQVALQFPDEQLADAASVTRALSEHTDSKIFILGDTSYGR